MKKEDSQACMLVILDGWGNGPQPEVSAIDQAKTPFMDHLYSTAPYSELVTFGEEVGLPKGQMGNSEVGHLNIGAGRIVYQELLRINNAIKDGSFQSHEVLQGALSQAQEKDKAVHLVGLLSDGGVHSHINHLKALCDMAQQKGLERVYIHAIMDGRDTSPTSGLDYMKELLEHLEGSPIQVASIIGRYYAMDRDKRWERIQLAYDLWVNGKGTVEKKPLEAIQKSYAKGDKFTDEFILPISLTDDDGQPLARIEENNVVIFYNFRTDRPRQITTALTQEDFPEHGMKKMPLTFVTMTRYDDSFKGIDVVFSKENIKNTLGEILSQHGKSQIRIAETEKYPHVTFFFSGGREEPFEGEERIMLPSPKVATYDLKPEMSAVEITDAIIGAIQNQHPDFICLNYANTDMVGHTGVFDAAVKAAETVDQCVERLVETATSQGYATIIIADHGNSDYMINEDGSPHTAHTTNPVPCLYISPQSSDNVRLKSGKLADIAPTILDIMGITPPEDMTGQSLIQTL